MSCVNIQLAELQSLIADLGKDGGLISPSIYDTAQVVRYYPPPEGPEPAIEWLLDQQQSDGGWGEPSAPYARDVPTLATILALHTHQQDRQTAIAIDAGLAFLHQQAEQWLDFSIDDLPVATEMILPRLIQDANHAGLLIEPHLYVKLFKLRDRKCHQIHKINPQAGSAPTYSWEAWGQEVRPYLSDKTGVGHSPSATAAWLQQVESCASYRESSVIGQQYLKKAAAATGVNLPGVVPNVWPITGFEQVYGPYALFIADLFRQPHLQNLLRPQATDLWLTMQREGGISFGESFTPDVDDTALGLILLHMTGVQADANKIRQFKSGNHYYTFQGELNPSVFSNAHALYALSLLGEVDVDIERFLLQRQSADGRWLADKWHSSWIYTTLEVVLALGQQGYTDRLIKTVDVLLTHQHPDGGWGVNNISTQIETSYAVLALYHLARLGVLNEWDVAALKCGQQWLAHHYRPYVLLNERCWLGKELYTPYRVDRIYVLCANLAVAQMQEEAWLPKAILA